MEEDPEPRGRLRQMWIDTLKTDLVKVAPGKKQEKSENRERWREMQKCVEAARALNEDCKNQKINNLVGTKV